MNHVVSLIFTKSILKRSFTDASLEDVIISCVSVRVDQLHRYLTILENNVLSKITDPNWIDAVNHISKVCLFSLSVMSA